MFWAAPLGYTKLLPTILIPTDSRINEKPGVIFAKHILPLGLIFLTVITDPFFITCLDRTPTFTTHLARVDDAIPSRT